MVGALFDTYILIDNLKSITAARDELNSHRAKVISIVTWIEVMAGTSIEQEPGTRAFLADFQVIPIDDTIAERAALLRRQTRVKLPDAVIWATAQVTSRLLITRNTRDFPADDPGVRIPYGV